MMKKLVTITVVASVTILSGCEAMRERHVQDLRNTAFKRSSNPSYADGFVDGCDSSHSPSSFKKNTKRFIEDKYYNTGWQDGLMHCEKKTKELNDTSESLRRLSESLENMK